MSPLRRALAVLAVVAASLAGGLSALWAYDDEQRVSAARVALSVSPFHHGALDIYVPVLDWGVRFGGVRFPARLSVEVRTIERDRARRVARLGLVSARQIRAEARDAIAAYLRRLALIAAGAGLLAGLVTAAAVTAGRRTWWLRLAPVAVLMAVGWAAVTAFLLAPRGDLGGPVYYARGSEIPVALKAIENASRTPDRLSEELDAQLLGLARLVVAPGQRAPLRGLPRVIVASDLHNNAVAVPALRAAAAGAPVLFAGDVSDRGTPVETELVRSVARAGRPLVLVGGNHDSDRSMRTLARAGAIVLTSRGRLLPRGGYGPAVVAVGGLRVAGYTSPNLRRAATGYRDPGSEVGFEEKEAFLDWLRPLLARVDVVLVHEPELIESALSELGEDPPGHPLLFAVGHTHRQGIQARDDLVVVNGGTAGAGGTGNLTETGTIGLAIVTYDRAPFRPLAVDLVQTAPSSGAASARRVRLDGGPVEIGGGS